MKVLNQQISICALSIFFLVSCGTKNHSDVAPIKRVENNVQATEPRTTTANNFSLPSIISKHISEPSVQKISVAKNQIRADTQESQMQELTKTITEEALVLLKNSLSHYDSLVHNEQNTARVDYLETQIAQRAHDVIFKKDLFISYIQHEKSFAAAKIEEMSRILNVLQFLVENLNKLNDESFYISPGALFTGEFASVFNFRDDEFRLRLLEENILIDLKRLNWHLDKSNKDTLSDPWKLAREEEWKKKQNRPLWKIFEDIFENMTDDELDQYDKKIDQVMSINKNQKE